jgi:hypothetical protein
MALPPHQQFPAPLWQLWAPAYLETITELNQFGGVVLVVTFREFKQKGRTPRTYNLRWLLPRGLDCRRLCLTCLTGDALHAACYIKYASFTFLPSKELE